MKNVTKKNGTKAPAGRAKQSGEDELPDGFDPLEFGRVAGWFKMAPKNSVQGTMQDSFTTDGKYGPKKTYKILITRGQTDVVQEGEDTVATVGELIGLDEKGFLKRLADVPQGAEVFVKCTGKSAPTKEYPQGAWNFALGVAKGTKVERHARGRSNEGDQRPSGDDDIPF